MVLCTRPTARCCTRIWLLLVVQTDYALSLLRGPPNTTARVSWSSCSYQVSASGTYSSWAQLTSGLSATLLGCVVVVSSHRSWNQAFSSFLPSIPTVNTQRKLDKQSTLYYDNSHPVTSLCTFKWVGNHRGNSYTLLLCIICSHSFCINILSSSWVETSLWLLNYEVDQSSPAYVAHPRSRPPDVSRHFNCSWGWGMADFAPFENSFNVIRKVSHVVSIRYNIKKSVTQFDHSNWYNFWSGLNVETSFLVRTGSGYI